MDGSRTDPLAHFARFLDKEQRASQFTEDIRKVIHGEPGGGPPSRARSPGLAAGAALALGAAAASASEVAAVSRTARLQMSARDRNAECPFDDHKAFGAGPADMQYRPHQGPAPALGDLRQVHEASSKLRKEFRQLQTKVGAGAPFDAPEREVVTSSAAAAQRAVWEAKAAGAFQESQAEALRYKARMRGSNDLLTGGYSAGSEPRGTRGADLLPRPQLLPQAHVKLQFDGGSIASLTPHRAEYLNSKVLAEANRDRNEARSHRWEQ